MAHAFSSVEMDDMMEFGDEVHNLEYEGWSEDLWTNIDDGMSDLQAADTSPKFLNNQDYTLNSPLICDQLDAFKDYLIRGFKSKMFYVDRWMKTASSFKTIRGDWSNLKPSIAYHAECARLWSDKQISCNEFSKLIQSADVHAKETHDIVKAYYKAWTGRTLDFFSRSNNSEDTLRYGALMLDNLKISWILNATTEYELQELKESLNFEYIKLGEPRSGVVYKSESFGVTYLVDGMMYIPEINMLWDRNMLLMFKDTSTARFHTLFAIQHRQFDKYSSDHLKVMERLYRDGDKVLMHDSSTAYEVFGMIEPLSSLMLSELAGKHRPLIPKFIHFRNHVDAKMLELSLVNQKAIKFFDTIKEVSSKNILLTIYGSFRHWGHPFISYLEGLAALYKNVTSTKDVINKEYADCLASDLAFKILRKEFRNKFRWFVDPTRIPDNHILKEHIINHTWPTTDVLISYPPLWHKLPLIPCWDIPEVVDPAVIYSDKTHSIRKSELIEHLSNRPNKPIPTRKVLDTLIHTPSTNWPEFLRRVNDFGLSDDELIIGLKAKEREIKWKGRFFALMGWSLREYFVFTEYLIKKNVIPLFKGLTMADDQTTLVRKMLKNTSGQGGSDYKNITIANHIDYEKWNNFQRYEATEPVFTVIGKFFGLPKLFSRTHEFFSHSLIYYRDRPDLMMVVNGLVVNRDDNQRVCWNGQAGGLEGLRQKGWSVLNLLVIERESKIRNTSVQILAQGDNQVICTEYAVNPYKNEEDLINHLSSIQKNNEVIINAIRTATTKIGLRINEDETLQGADMLVYGKNIVFRGNFTCLEEKRLSRITCTTNDQLPSLANILSTVSTNCLTIAHYSKSPKNSMVSYNWLGNFVLNILNMHNPALRCAPHRIVNQPKMLSNKNYRIAALYLDPSIGGISGMSLTRFHIRMFPDPVTESIAFWKAVSEGTDNREIKELACNFGKPKLSKFSMKHIPKLLEDPASINIPRGLSAQNLIKDEIKRALLRCPDKIVNEVVQDAVTYTKHQEGYLRNYLHSINPFFPRFLSEMKSATYFGLTDGIIGLFENSKTIRNLFKRKFRELVDTAIVKCELGSIQSLIAKCHTTSRKMWPCSASQADILRLESWGRKVLGTTVPHPIEMVRLISDSPVSCKGCSCDYPKNIHVIVLVPSGMNNPEEKRGPYSPYLGSSTSENTSLIQSWEKDTDISFMRKASNLRRAFHWFIRPDSNLGLTIKGNLQAMTHENPGDTITGFKRTGSPLHRFGCSRISAGGYVASNSVYGSRMIISTDNFNNLGEDNYDFMYQPMMLFVQQTVGELHEESPVAKTYHFHISCVECLRKIEEPELDAPSIFEFPDVSENLKKWKTSNTPWFKEAANIEIPIGDWDQVNHNEKSLQVGLSQGLLFGLLYQSYSNTNVLNNLFPIALRSKVYGPSYLQGLKDGLYRSATMNAIHRRIFYRINSIDLVIRACYVALVEEISSHTDFLIFLKADALVATLRLSCARIPPSFPLNNHDLGAMIKSTLLSCSYHNWRFNILTNIPKIWIFADLISVQISGMIVISYDLLESLKRLSVNDFRNRARELSELLSSLKTGTLEEEVQNIIGVSGKILLCTSEVRHALPRLDPADMFPRINRRDPVFFNQVNVQVNSHVVEYTSLQKDPPVLDVPRIQNPLISGIRIPQISTGSFLKMEGLLSLLRLSPEDILCGGDGSGGISASLLRKFIKSRLIFNSLLDFTGVDLGGSLPSPPSALAYMSEHIRARCVNLNTVWEYPSDLSQVETWKGFIALKKKYQLRISLMVFDMEIQSDEMSAKIEDLLCHHLRFLLEGGGTVIFKTYLHRLISKNSPLYNLGAMFHLVRVTQNELSSSHTSEVYIVFQKLRSSSLVKLYPRWETLYGLMRNAYCMQSYREEFTRARRVLRMDLVYGIPRCFMPDPRQELGAIWETISSDKVTVVRLIGFLEIGATSLSRLGIIVSYVLSNQIINTTRWSTDKTLIIPSDNDLAKYFAYHVGTMLYYALVLNRPDIGEIFQKMINNSFFVFFYQKRRTTSKKNPQLLYQTQWSVAQRKDWVKYKKVFLQDKLALIGSVIRYLLSISKEPGLASFNSWALRSADINRGFGPDHVRNSTGCIDGFVEDP